MRWTLFVFNFAAVAVMPIFLVGPAKSANHFECVYRGWRLNQADENGQPCGIDVRIDAGQPFAPGLETGGRWASLWVGSDARGPNAERYAAALRVAVFAVLLLLVTAAGLSNDCAAGLAPWLAGALWLLHANVSLFDAGQVELTMVGPLVALYFSGLRRLHRKTCLWAWLALAISSFLGWQLFPLIWLAFFLPAMAVWLIVAWQHPWWWHGLVASAAVLGAAPLFAEWRELARLYPLIDEAIAAEGRRLWVAVGESTTRLATLIAIHFAIAALPCVTTRILRQSILTLGVAAGAAAIVVVLQPNLTTQEIVSWPPIFGRPTLPRDFPGWQTDLSTRIDNTARVLCEAADGDKAEPIDVHALLLGTQAPILAGARSDADAVPWSFSAGRLAGRSLNDWTDDELSRLAERWNIGWVLTQSKAATARFSRYPNAVRLPIRDLPTNVEAFAIDRRHRYFLRGTGHWNVEPNGHLTLSETTPDAGEVVVSLRYHTGWTSKPTVKLDPEVDPYDPWPIVSLRLHAPIDRLVLCRDGQ